MELNQIASNQNEINTGTRSILFSYSTPVAYIDLETGACYRTSKKWSVTTSKHINKWLDGRSASEVTQDILDSLL